MLQNTFQTTNQFFNKWGLAGVQASIKETINIIEKTILNFVAKTNKFYFFLILAPKKFS